MITEFPYIVACYENQHATEEIAAYGFLYLADAEAWFLTEPPIPGEVTRDLLHHTYGSVFEILEPTRRFKALA